VHIERTTEEVRLYGCEKNLKMADKLLKELAEETDIQVVQGMVSPELLEQIALSMGVTLRVRDIHIEVLGRKDAIQSASTELEKLLQKAGFCEKALETETQSIQSQSTTPSPQGPKIAEMGQNLQNIHSQTQPVENRCHTCHCGRFCGTCGAQIWQTIPVFNMAPMPAVSTMNTMNTLGMAVTGYGMGTEMSGLSKEDDSPAAQTPYPAEECGHPTMMFPMFQMAQAPCVLVPAESGLNGQVCKVKGPKDADRFDVLAEPGSLVKPLNVEQVVCHPGVDTVTKQGVVLGLAKSLQCTFSFPVGTRFARPGLFDIRDEICFAVGGFRHGQVVEDNDGDRAVVVGVRCEEDWEATPNLWFKCDGNEGAGLYNDYHLVRKDFKVLGRRELQEVLPSDPMFQNQDTKKRGIFKEFPPGRPWPAGT